MEIWNLTFRYPKMQCALYLFGDPRSSKSHNCQSQISYLLLAHPYCRTRQYLFSIYSFCFTILRLFFDTIRCIYIPWIYFITTLSSLTVAGLSTGINWNILKPKVTMALCTVYNVTRVVKLVECKQRTIKSEIRNQE